MTTSNTVPKLIPLHARRPAIDLDAEADLARCGALKDYWYVACLSSELTAKAPLGRVVFGTPVALFRGRDGKPAALLDRCLHRNARLSAGATFDGCIGCPYHGWTYDQDGRCVNIPSLGPQQKGSRLDEDGHACEGLKLTPLDVGRVRSFPTLEQDGLVYVFLGGDAARARKAPFRIPYKDDPEWRTYFMVTRFPNGVTNLVENFMDVPHTVFVHEGWFRKPAKKEVPALVERRDESVLVTYEQDQDRLTGLGPVLNLDGGPMTHTDRFYAPNITRVDYGFGNRAGFVITSQCTPVGPTESVVYTAIGYRLPLDVPGRLLSRAFEPLLHWYTRQVIEQDVKIMRVQRDGLTGAPGGGEFQSTEADLLHADIEAYRSWLRDGAEGDGPEPAARRIAFWI